MLLQGQRFAFGVVKRFPTIHPALPFHPSFASFEVGGRVLLAPVGPSARSV